MSSAIDFGSDIHFMSETHTYNDNLWVINSHSCKICFFKEMERFVSSILAGFSILFSSASDFLFYPVAESEKPKNFK
jgi:hypothetical protein